jgi:uncharacterized phage protein (TIGR01671 family)
MCREIKFRSWDFEKKKMNYLPNSGFERDTLFFTTRGYNDTGCCYEGDNLNESLERFNCTLMQYTGVKDKNGKNVYEGDNLGNSYEGCYIAWCKDCKSFQVFNCFDKDYCMQCNGDISWLEFINDDDIEVVGNIHENIELNYAWGVK